jgi:hypothetical protein
VAMAMLASASDTSLLKDAGSDSSRSRCCCGAGARGGGAWSSSALKYQCMEPCSKVPQIKADTGSNARLSSMSCNLSGLPQSPDSVPEGHLRCAQDLHQLPKAVRSAAHAATHAQLTHVLERPGAEVKRRVEFGCDANRPMHQGAGTARCAWLHPDPVLVHRFLRLLGRMRRATHLKDAFRSPR